MPLVELCAFTVPGRAEPKGSVSAYNDRLGVARVKFGSTTKRKDGSRTDGPARYAAWCRQVAAAIFAAAWKAARCRSLMYMFSGTGGKQSYVFGSS